MITVMSTVMMLAAAIRHQCRPLTDPRVLPQTAECLCDFIRLRFNAYSQILDRLSIVFRSRKSQELADRHIAPQLKLKLAQAASEPPALLKGAAQAFDSQLFMQQTQAHMGLLSKLSYHDFQQQVRDLLCCTTKAPCI